VRLAESPNVSAAESPRQPRRIRESILRKTSAASIVCAVPASSSPLRYLGFPCLLRISVGRPVQALEQGVRERRALALGKLEREV